MCDTIQIEAGFDGGTNTVFRVDMFFKNLLPPLTTPEREMLKEGIRRDGKCDALKAARIAGIDGVPTLWDGHNRNEIVNELRAEGVPVAEPAVEIRDFADRSEVALAIINNQNARRNWSQAERAIAIVSNESAKEIADAARDRQRSGKKAGLPEGQGSPTKGRTDEILGKLVGCGRDYIRKARNVLKAGDVELVEKVKTQQVSLRDAHKSVVEQQRKAKAEQARQERKPYAYRESDGWENQIFNGNAAEKLRLIPAGAASLVFFSPPYPTKLVKYDIYEYDGDYHRWMRGLLRVLKRAHQALRSGGRVVINVDATSDCMKQATTKFDIQYDVKTLAKRAGFTFADDIAWFKQTTCGSDAHVVWGTYCSPHKPNVRRAHEYVLVFYKDSPYLEVDGAAGRSEAEVKAMREAASDILPEEFRHATISAWNFDAKNRRSSDHVGNVENVNASSFWYIRAQRRDGSHPAPFSEPLAEIVIKTYTYRGDLVIDPFSGSGTTAVVAQRLGRRWVGIDVSADYCAVAQERLRQQTEAIKQEMQSEGKDSIAKIDGATAVDNGDAEGGIAA